MRDMYSCVFELPEMKSQSYVFKIPDWWDLKHCYIDINLESEEYEVLHCVPNKIVERYNGKLKKWSQLNAVIEDDGK